MPELPEVEVTAQALREAIVGSRLLDWRFSGKRLRHPFPRAALSCLKGEAALSVGRRAKYVLIEFSSGWLAVHLGMSGSINCRPKSLSPEPGPHDHVVMDFRDSNQIEVVLTYHDPRRFGGFQWVKRDRCVDRDIGSLLGESAAGLEPFDERFDGDYLFLSSRGRRLPIKPWLMQGQAVVGVGNIYACEALFESGIHPARKAHAISRLRYVALASAIQRILKNAIAQGGSSISDFVGPDGEPGRYGAAHQVYGREAKPCPQCARPIVRIVQAQRASFFCRGCQR